MDTPGPGRIFISYAVRDGSEAARALRDRLQRAGFAIWQDVVALKGGRDWWSQIEEATRAKSVEHLVLARGGSVYDPVLFQHSASWLNDPATGPPRA